MPPRLLERCGYLHLRYVYKHYPTAYLYDHYRTPMEQNFIGVIVGIEQVFIRQ